MKRPNDCRGSDKREHCLLWYITLENTEGAIKKGKSTETGNIGYTKRRKRIENTTQYVLDTTIYKQTEIT